MNARILHAPRTRSIRIDWITYAMIAVFGSLFYGASLSVGTDDAGSGCYAAVALAVSAGTGWVVFGLVFLALMRPQPGAFAHACLVTMVWGECVLALGGILNLAGFSESVGFNIGLVLVSNIVMAVVLSRRLSRIGIALPVTLILWMLVLNFTGLLVFTIFYPEILS